MYVNLFQTHLTALRNLQAQLLVATTETAPALLVEAPQTLKDFVDRSKSRRTIIKAFWGELSDLFSSAPKQSRKRMISSRRVRLS